MLVVCSVDGGWWDKLVLSGAELTQAAFHLDEQVLKEGQVKSKCKIWAV